MRILIAIFALVIGFAPQSKAQESETPEVVESEPSTPADATAGGERDYKAEDKALKSDFKANKEALKNDYKAAEKNAATKEEREALKAQFKANRKAMHDRLKEERNALKAERHANRHGQDKSGSRHGRSGHNSGKSENSGSGKNH